MFVYMYTCIHTHTHCMCVYIHTHIYLYHNFLSSFMDRHLGTLEVFISLLLGIYTAHRLLEEGDGSSNFNFLRNFHIGFQSGCIDLHSY